jgi:hypothetical protein
LKAAWLLLPLVVAACATKAPLAESDWERENRIRLQGEDQVILPPYPKKENLAEIYVSATTTGFQYYVDTASLLVGRDRTVRYVFLARSPSGVENVTYEAIRCPWEHRVLAVGRPDGSWAGRPSSWREITRGGSLGWQYALARNYFCPHRDSIQTVAEGVDALRNGIHPAVEVQRSMGGGDQ